MKNPTLRYIAALLSGIIVGSVVNMGLVFLGPHVIAPPEGADVTTMEGLKASLHLFQPKHFLFPFLAHAIGTLTGAFIAAKIFQENKMRAAMIIGLIFLAGGVMNIISLPSPLWFSIADLVGAYMPMAYLAKMLAEKY